MTTTRAIVRPAETLCRVRRGRGSRCASARRASSGAGSTSFSRPTSSIRSTRRGSCSRAQRGASAGRPGPRTRFFLATSTTLEAVDVPVFRRGRFDQLDEPTSPFNLLRCDALRLAVGDAAEPDVRAGADAPGRHRGSRRRPGESTGVCPAYRGFARFRSSTARCRPSAATPDPLGLVETFPRFTMIGGDFETVRGEWGIRGEVAVFVDDELQSTRLSRGVAGQSVEAGVGVDRRAGDYRVAANVLWSWRASIGRPVGRAFDDAELDRTDFSIVMAADRSSPARRGRCACSRVYNPGGRDAFARVIAAFSLRDNCGSKGPAACSPATRRTRSAG